MQQGPELQPSIDPSEHDGPIEPGSLNKGDVVTGRIDDEPESEWEYRTTKADGTVVVAVYDRGTKVTRFREVPKDEFSGWRRKPPTTEEAASESPEPIAEESEDDDTGREAAVEKVARTAGKKTVKAAGGDPARTAEKTDDKGEKVSYAPEGFWRGPTESLPISILSVQEHDGKRYATVRWWAGQDMERSGTRTFIPVEELLTAGQTVKVMRPDGSLEDGWMAGLPLDDHTHRITVLKPEEGKDEPAEEEEVSWEDLWAWQQPDEEEETGPGPTPPPPPAAAEAATGPDEDDDDETTWPTPGGDPTGPEPGPAGGGDPLEIPPEVLAAAAVAHIPEDQLRAMRAIMKDEAPEDALEFLDKARHDPKLRKLVYRFYGIELSEPDTEEELHRVPLKSILKVPDELVAKPTDTDTERERKRLARDALSVEQQAKWGTEYRRRQAAKAAELEHMLKRFREFIPSELPLRPTTKAAIAPDMHIPDDPEGAYGLWRRLKIQEYDDRIFVYKPGRTKKQQKEALKDLKKVRKELKKTGGIRRLGGRTRLARKILKTEKAANRAAGSSKNYGTFGIGGARYRQIMTGLKNYDSRVADARRGLGPKNRPTYIKDGQQTARRHLAESIITLRQQELAHQKGRLDPVIPRQNDDHIRPIGGGSGEMVS